MVTSEGHWEIVDDRAKNVEADAEAPKVVAKVADVGEGGGEVVATPVVRFGDLKYPPAASSTAGKAWYSFRPEHGLGPLIAGGWHHAQALRLNTFPIPKFDASQNHFFFRRERFWAYVCKYFTVCDFA